MTNVGGIMGKNGSNGFTIENNYYKEGIKTSEDNTIGESKTEEEMKEQDFVDLLNNGQDEEVWEIVKGRNRGFPVIKGM